jgi:hypothetical protein
MSAPLAGRHHASQTCATCANMSRQVFSDQGIHSLDVLVCAWCQWAARLDFIRYTCSSLKTFYPLVDLSLMHGACSILCQHLAMDFLRFNPLCPQKTHYGALFSMVQSLSGAVILLPSLLSAMWLNDGMLRAANYTSSLAHIGVVRQHHTLVFTTQFQNCLYFLFHLHIWMDNEGKKQTLTHSVRSQNKATSVI